MKNISNVGTRSIKVKFGFKASSPIPIDQNFRSTSYLLDSKGDAVCSIDLSYVQTSGPSSELSSLMVSYQQISDFLVARGEFSEEYSGSLHELEASRAKATLIIVEISINTERILKDSDIIEISNGIKIITRNFDRPFERVDRCDYDLSENNQVADILTKAIGVVLSMIQQLQLSIYMVKRDFITKLVNSRDLPPLLPLVFQQNLDGDTVSNFSVVQNYKSKYFLLNSDSPLTVDESETLKKNINKINTAYESNYFNMFRESEFLARHEGMYTPAIVLLSTALEVLINDTYLMLEWERCVSPEVVSAEWGGLDHRKSKLRESLKITPSKFKDYENNVKNLRNKIAHTGYAASEEEYERAYHSATLLTKVISDAAASNLNLYPVSAHMILGKGGAQKRGLTEGIHNKVIAPADRAGVDIRRQFHHWKEIWIRIRGDQTSKRVPKTTKSKKILVYDKHNNNFKFYFWSEATYQVRRGEVISFENAKKVKSDLVDLTTNSPNKSIAYCFVEGCQLKPAPNSFWVEEYKVLNPYLIYPDWWLDN